MKPILGISTRLSAVAWLNVAFAGITAAIGLGGWLIAFGLQNQLNQLARQREEGTALLRRTVEMHAGHENLQEQTRTAKRLVESLRARLPESPEETSFLQQLSELAAAKDVELSDFQPGGIAEHADVNEIELHVRGTGKYAGLCRLLAGLGELPRIVRVSQLTILAPSERGGNCAIDLQLCLLFGLNAGRPGETKVQP